MKATELQFDWSRAGPQQRLVVCFRNEKVQASFDNSFYKICEESYRASLDENSKIDSKPQEHDFGQTL